MKYAVCVVIYVLEQNGVGARFISPRTQNVPNITNGVEARLISPRTQNVPNITNGVGARLISPRTQNVPNITNGVGARLISPRRSPPYISPLILSRNITIKRIRNNHA